MCMLLGRCSKPFIFCHSESRPDNDILGEYWLLSHIHPTLNTGPTKTIKSLISILFYFPPVKFKKQKIHILQQTTFYIAYHGLCLCKWVTGDLDKTSYLMIPCRLWAKLPSLSSPLHPHFSIILRNANSLKCPRKYPSYPWNSEQWWVLMGVLNAGTGVKLHVAFRTRTHPSMLLTLQTALHNS